MLATGESDLAAYVVAAHHGRVRMSIRSMPGEEDGRVRGIRGGVDILPACEPARGVLVSEILLSLDAMKLGQDGSGAMSWTDRVLRLRDRLGPFRLTYLEMLLRAADERASAAKQEAAGCGS
jgi:CRISPR-associated endonuclease/helicase Cas3